MNQFARVDSVDVLKAVRVALCKFADTAKLGLDESEADVRQAGVWLEQEQFPHWRSEVFRLREQVQRMKLELTRKEYTKQMLDSAMSLVEDRKALTQVKRRLEEAEARLERVKRWMRRLEQETFAFKGGIQGLWQSLHHDVPNALARLDNMIEAIESYAAVRPAADEPPPPPRSPEEEPDR